jgi:hypothetical protein
MYVKVFSQILESSLSVDYEQRHIFMDLLVLADRTGVVDMTLEAISRRINVPVDMVSRNIKKLEIPDQESRSDEQEGRRLVLLDEHRDWGWQIVNYEHYRDLVDLEALRVANRERKRRQREKERQSRDVLNGHKMSRNVRDSHAPSQKVTPSESYSVSNSDPKEKEREMSLPVRVTQNGTEDLSLSSEVLPKPKPKLEARPKSWAEFLAFCQSRGLSENDSEYLYSHWQSNGWRTGKQEIKSWKHAVQTWKAGGFLPSQKPK